MKISITVKTGHTSYRGHTIMVGGQFGTYKIESNLIYVMKATINHCDQKPILSEGNPEIDKNKTNVG